MHCTAVLLQYIDHKANDQCVSTLASYFTIGGKLPDRASAIFCESVCLKIITRQLGGEYTGICLVCTIFSDK